MLCRTYTYDRLKVTTMIFDNTLFYGGYNYGKIKVTAMLLHNVVAHNTKVTTMLLYNENTKVTHVIKLTTMMICNAI